MKDSALQLKWYAVHTKYKAERWVTKKLKAKGVEAYTPLVSMTKKYTKKITTHYYPLITCYAFVKINSNDKAKVLQTEHLFDFVRFRGKMIEIPEEEINVLKRISGENIASSVSIDEKFIGEEVEIISGNLTGIKGVLIEIQGRKSFVVELENLGFRFKINIDPSQLNLVNPKLILV